MTTTVDLKAWCDEARRLLSAKKRKQKNNIGIRSDQVLELLNLIKPVPELADAHAEFLKRFETLATNAKQTNDHLTKGAISKIDHQNQIIAITRDITLLKGDMRLALAQQVLGTTDNVKEQQIKGAEQTQKFRNELLKLREEVGKLGVPYTDLYQARQMVYVQIKKEDLAGATKGFEELKKTVAEMRSKEEKLREKLATLEKLAPEILRLDPVARPLGVGRERLQAGDLKGAETQLLACEASAGTLQPGTQDRVRSEIEADLEELYQKATYGHVGMLLRKGKNCDENGFRKFVRTALKGQDYIAARAEVTRFREAIAEALKATPRAPIDLTKLKDVEESYGKMELESRFLATQQTNVRFARNTEQARSAAVRLVTESGGLAKDIGPLSDMPFAPSNELKRLQEEVEGSEHQGTAQSKHMLKVLKKIEKDEAVQAKILEIGAPPDTKEGKLARDMIRATLSLPPDTQITDAHARQAAVAALMNQLRQRDVGSCFASSVAVEAQAKKPEIFLQDMKTLFSSGKIVRQRTKLDKKEKIPKTGHKFDQKRGVKEALLAMGVAEGAIAGAVNAAIVELWKTLPTGATEGEFTVEEVIKEAAKEALKGKNTEETEKGLAASKEAFLEAGKVEIELNPDMSTGELDRTTKILPATKLHTLPAYAAALDAMGIPAGEQEAEVEAALIVLRKGAPANIEGDYFTPKEVFREIAKARKASGKSNNAEEEDTRAAETSFQAQQDNRLLRAWEYSVAGLAEANDEKGAKIRAAAGKVAESAIASYIDTLPKGTKTEEKKQFTKDLQAEVDRLLKERCGVRYDASVKTPPSADGSSSRGVWVLEDKKTKKKAVDKASQDELIRELLEEATAKFTSGDAKTWAEGAADHAEGKALSTTDPLALSGATEGGCEALIGAFNDEEPPEMHKKRPANGDELFEWLITSSQSLEGQIGGAVDGNPEDASLPMYNGPHAFSLMPGSPLLRKAAKAGSPAEAMNEFKEKHSGIKETRYPITDPLSDPVKKFLEKGLAVMGPSWTEAAIHELEAQLSRKSEISIAAITKIVDDTIAVEYKEQLKDERTENLQKSVEKLEDGLFDENHSTCPDFALAKPLPEAARRALGPALAHLDAAFLQAAIDALEKLAEAGTTSLNTKKLRDEGLKAALAAMKKDQEDGIQSERTKSGKGLTDGLLSGTAPVVLMLTLNDPTDGEIKTMIDAAANTLTGTAPDEFRIAAEKRLTEHRRNGELAIELPRIREIIEDVLKIEYATETEEKRRTMLGGMVEKVSATMTEDPPAATLLIPNADGNAADDLVVKALSGFGGDKSDARDTIMGELQSGGAGLVSVAQVQAAIKNFFDAQVAAAGSERDQAKDTAEEEFLAAVFTDDSIMKFPLNEEPDGKLLESIDAAVSHITNDRKREKMKKRAIDRFKGIQKSGAAEISLLEVTKQVMATITEDQKKEDKESVKELQEASTNALSQTVLEEVIPPVEKADLDNLIAEAMKKLGITDPQAGEVKTEALKAFATLTGKATMPQVTKAVKEALALKGAAKNDEEVNGALRPPPGPKGMVFADSNWGTGDKRTMFSMVMNPLTDKMEMWQMSEDGSDTRRMNQKTWTECGWGMPKDAQKSGGVV